METTAKTGSAGHAGATVLQHNAVPDVAPSSEGALPFFGGLPVQAKLEVSPPDDPQEREADNVADEVMRMPETTDAVPVQASAAPGMVQMKCDACEAEESVHRFPEPAIQRENIVQRKCAACGQEENVQRKCEACEAEESVHRFPEPAIQRENIVQRKCAACEQEESIQRKCAACEAEETVQRFPEPAAKRTSVIQRSCDECKIDAPKSDETAEDQGIEDELTKNLDEDGGGGSGDDGGDGTVSPKAGPGGAGPVPSQFESGLQASKGGGQPMAAPLRESMENRFGRDFSHVRIHNGNSAANLSGSINAQAFTHGSDIYFNQNKYDASSSSGQRLLAHELTHVVQQTGASAIQPKIQRKDRVGKWAHNEIQFRMRARDADLVTEAGVPGAVRYAKGINLAGFADLYKAQGNIVSGMQAHKAKAQGEYDYIRFMQTGKKLGEMQMKGGKKPPQGPVKKPDGTWDFTTNFPTSFEIGEIKPLFITEFPDTAEMIGSGMVQQSNYILGFQQFVEHVHKIFPASIPTTKGSPMDLSPLVPPSVNYDNFDTEHKKTDKDAILKLNTKQRLWFGNLGKGLGGYFFMPHPYIPTEYADDKKKHRDKLDALLKSLREDAGKPTLPPAISKASTGVAKKAIQRKPDDKSKNQNKAAEDWEKKRKAWATGTDKDVPQKPKKFLKERAKGLLKRNKVDKELKKTTPPDQAKEIKDVKDVKFWSSFKGRVFGALRFRFRRAFDKIEELFNKVKAKFEKHREKSKTLKGGEKFTLSWKKEAVNLIVQLAVDIFQRMIAIAFEGFSNCMSSIIDAVLGKYEKALLEAAEEDLKKFEPLCCDIMEFKHKWEAEVEKHDKVISEFTQSVDEMREWVAVLDKVELAVRLGVQIISCGTPPALGCLWGLVAQLGISAGMALLQKTEYWKNNIAQPAAEALMEAIVGDKLHNMMIEVMKGTPLGEFMGADACQPRKKGSGSGSGGLGAIGQGLEKIDPNDPAIAKIRADWEAQYKDQMMADLKEFFESGEKGKPLTPEDIQKMVEAIKNSGKKPEELKKMIEEGRNAKSGKVDLKKALASVTSGTVPGDKPKKERKIDYENAKRNNLYYSNMLGWLATLFIKKPGIDPGSAEFADAVYDMQEALGIHADGIAGAGTTQQFYTANGIPQDKVFDGAVKLEAKEKQAKADKKSAEEFQKRYDAIMKDPKVQESMTKTYPSRDDLKKALTSKNWDAIEKGSGIFEKRNDHFALIVFRSHENAVLGTFVKIAEWKEGTEVVDKILESGEYYALNDIPKLDGISFVISGRSKSNEQVEGMAVIPFMEAHPADSFFSISKTLFFDINLKRP